MMRDSAKPLKAALPERAQSRNQSIHTAFQRTLEFKISPSPPKKIGITLCDAYLFLTEKLIMPSSASVSLPERAHSRNLQIRIAFQRTLEFVNLSFSAKE